MRDYDVDLHYIDGDDDDAVNELGYYDEKDEEEDIFSELGYYTEEGDFILYTDKEIKDRKK